MKSRSVIAAAFLVCAFAVPAFSSALGDQLAQGVNLTDEERVGLEPLLARYYAAEGTREALSATLKNGAEKGCRGQCLADLVEMMTRSMKTGVACEAASKEVGDALKAVSDRCRAQGIKASSLEIGRAVRGMMEAKLKDREGSLKIIGEK